MKKQKVLKIVFLGKKPVYFDEFLVALNEKIQDGKFFNDRFKNVDEIIHQFFPKSKDFDFVTLSCLFEEHQEVMKKKKEQLAKDLENDNIPLETLVDIDEKMIVVHFGKVPAELLSMVHTKNFIELNFFSISERTKGRKAHQRSGRRVFYFKNKKCKTIFVQHKDVA